MKDCFGNVFSNAGCASCEIFIECQNEFVDREYKYKWRVINKDGIVVAYGMERSYGDCINAIGSIMPGDKVEIERGL